MSGRAASAPRGRAHHKITPPGFPATTVERRRVDELFAALLEDHEALAVFAGAGAGKTVAAQLFARRFDWPVAWLTLDAADRSPARLLAYLGSTLAPHLDVPGAQRADPSGSEVLAGAVDLALRSGARRLLVVFDQCETLADAPDACAVLEAFLDTLAGDARTLLLSRSELDLPLGRLLLHGRAARVTDADLALTFDEAIALGHATGQTRDEVEQLWEASHGWFPAVAFGRSTRSSDAGPGSDLRSSVPHDLRSYLQREVFDPLSPAERRFLLDTSVLDAVPLRVATLLCGPESQQVWHRIELRHLPATTTSDRTIVYHPSFRAFLREELESSDPDRYRVVQRRHAELLAQEHRFEEAIALLLRVGAIDEAAVATERAVPEMLARGEWDQILGWLDHLGRRRVEESRLLVGARIAALRGARRIHECRALIEQLDRDGRLRDVLETDGRLVTHAAWAMLWRPLQGLSMLDRYDADRRAGGVRYLLQVMSGEDPVVPPRGQPWDENDRLVSWGLMLQGRLDELVRMLPPAQEWPPRSPYTTPHPLLGLVWRGELARARQLFEQVPLDEKARVHTDLWHYLESWLLIAEGDYGAAAEVAEQAVSYSRRTRFHFEPVFQIAEAEALLGLDRVDEAMQLLDESLVLCRNASATAYVEWALTFLGKAHLQLGDDEVARGMLEEATSGMARSRRVLMLPMAAAFLAEAHARLGHPDLADDAAGQAYDAALDMRSLFALQLALRAFPGVLQRQRAGSRQLDWRDVGSLQASPGEAGAAVTPSVTVTLHPFGADPHLLVDGERVPIRRLKVLELVAFLSATGDEGVARAMINVQLFPNSDRQHGSNHFRQVAHQLRRTAGLSLQRTADGCLRWEPGVVVRCADVELERTLVEARSLVGPERFERMAAALAEVDGPYLAASDLEWASTRRRDLDVLVAEAEAEVARAALDRGDYDRARHFAQRVLERDPYMEAAYRILVEVELAVGTDHGALAVYRRLVAALAELGLGPDPEVGALIEHRHRSMA